MDKEILQHVSGQRSRVGEFDVVRALPHRDIRSVGPFVFVDQLPDLSFAPRTPSLQDGSEAHPHRGIITLSYSLEGEFYHYDSLGNSSLVGDGGAQWLKAGRVSDSRRVRRGHPNPQPNQ